MKKRRAVDFLIFFIVISILFSLKYLDLRHQHNSIKNTVRETLIKDLDSSVSFLRRIDVNKINSGDQEATMAVIHAYNKVSNSNAMLNATYSGKISVLFPGLIVVYESALSNIVDKSIKHQLTKSDADKINIIIDDLNLILKFLNENKSGDGLTELNTKLQYFKHDMK